MQILGDIARVEPLYPHWGEKKTAPSIETIKTKRGLISWRAFRVNTTNRFGGAFVCQLRITAHVHTEFLQLGSPGGERLLHNIPYFYFFLIL